MKQEEFANEKEFQIQLAMVTGWYSAALGRTKRLPSLKRFLRGEDKARKLEGEELIRRKQEHEEISKELAPELMETETEV